MKRVCHCVAAGEGYACRVAPVSVKQTAPTSLELAADCSRTLSVIALRGVACGADLS
jgi:hypothetical protein